MIHLGDHGAVHRIIQPREIHRHARHGVGTPGHGDLEVVVVAVGAVAVSIERYVALDRQSGVGEPVSRAEVIDARHLNHHAPR